MNDCILKKRGGKEQQNMQQQHNSMTSNATRPRRKRSQRPVQLRERVQFNRKGNKQSHHTVWQLKGGGNPWAN